ncbi:HNH endonuclease [Bacillus sp. NEAU-Y102]
MGERYEGLQESLNKLGSLVEEEKSKQEENSVNEDAPTHEEVDDIFADDKDDFDVFGAAAEDDEGFSLDDVVKSKEGENINKEDNEMIPDVFDAVTEGAEDSENGVETFIGVDSSSGVDIVLERESKGDVEDFGNIADLSPFDTTNDGDSDVPDGFDFGSDEFVGQMEDGDSNESVSEVEGFDFGSDEFVSQLGDEDSKVIESFNEVAEEVNALVEEDDGLSEESSVVENFSDEELAEPETVESVVADVKEDVEGTLAEEVSIEEKSEPVKLVKDGVEYHTTTGSVREDIRVVTPEDAEKDALRKAEIEASIARAKEEKEKLFGNPDVQVNLDYVLEDEEGNHIEARNHEGTYLIDVVPIDKIKGVGSADDIVRKGDLELAALQEDIHRFGLLEPIHVVPHRHVGFRKDEDNNDILGRPLYNRYLLLSGRRRLEACINLGYTEVPVLVDSTVPPKLIKFYEALTNNMKEYTFPEKLSHANFLKRTQENITNDMVESILNWRSGEYLKAQYIDQMKNDYPDIYRQVDMRKMSIEQGFKKLEKEIEKAEKELQQAEMSEDDIDEKLREDSKDELTELQVDKQQQTVGNRHILDPMIRKSVEVRDLHCQCCGYGKGEEDFMGVFNVHHIIAVQYGGSDSKFNLILLCANCHKLVHDYEVGKFIPAQQTYDKRSDVKHIVVLGNMLKRMRGMAFEVIRKNHEDLWNLVNKGTLSIGKAILKAGIDLKGEAMFEPSPYEKFKEATVDLGLGGDITDELGVIEWTKEDDEQHEEIMSYGKL